MAGDGECRHLEPDDQCPHYPGTNACQEGRIERDHTCDDERRRSQATPEIRTRTRRAEENERDRITGEHQGRGPFQEQQGQAGEQRRSQRDGGFESRAEREKVHHANQQAHLNDAHDRDR
jgi:hypothetical protein